MDIPISMLVSSVYLPSFSLLAAMIRDNALVIDGCENFIKQTVRNRCHILSPNGVQTLIIPVVHNNRTNTPMKEIQISNREPWQRQHWRSIETAYRRSAFFEFYQDDFLPFYREEFHSLLEFNTNILCQVLNLLHLKIPVSYTGYYSKPEPEVSHDLRLACNSGDPVICSHSPVKYPQVFSNKYGFTDGLSIMDMLFNLGPQTGELLKRFHQVT